MIALGVGGCSKAKPKAKKTDDNKHPDRIVIVDREATAKVKKVVEKEPNNDTGSATPLSVGDLVRGNMDGSNDQDHYKVSIAKAGLLSATLSGIDKADLILELRDANNKRLARSDRGPAKTVEGLPNFPVTKGEYYLVVTEFVKKRRKKKRRRRRRRRKAKKAKKNEPPARVGKSPNYELMVTMSDKRKSVATSTTSAGESEPNDKITSAIELKQGVQGTGFIGWSKDRDVWKILLDDVSGDDVIDVDVAGVSGIRLVLEVLDVDGKLLARRWGAQGKAVIVRGLRPRAGQQAHFVRLRSRRSQPGESYTVSFASRKPDPADEVEPNDSIRSGTALLDGKATTPPQTGGLRRGYLTRGDVDYFKLPKRKEPLALSVSVNPPSEVDVVLFIMDGKGKKLSKADEGKRGTKESMTKLRIPANTVVVVKVSGHGNSVEPEHYELRWSVEEASVAAPPPAPAPDKDATKTPTKKSGGASDLDDDYGN